MKRLFASFLLPALTLGVTILIAGDSATLDARQRPAKPVPTIMLPIFPPLIQPACARFPGLNGAGVPCGGFEGDVAIPGVPPGSSFPMDLDYTLISRGDDQRGPGFLPPGGTFAGTQTHISLLGAEGGLGTLRPRFDSLDSDAVPGQPEPVHDRSVVWIVPRGAGSSFPAPVLLTYPYRADDKPWKP